MDEEDAWLSEELAELDLFARIPPELAADPQPSTWLDGEPLNPAIPGWQLRGLRVGPNQYILCRIADPASGRRQQTYIDGEGRPLVRSFAEICQAAEILSGEILTLVPGLLPSIAYFLPRDRPY